MIRKPESAEDWQSIRDICCQTAKNGAPIERDRWPFFGKIWIGPYQTVLPDWTWLAISDDQKIVGYLTGCPNTGIFEKRRLLRFDLPLVLQLFLQGLFRGRALPHHAAGDAPARAAADRKRYLKRLFRIQKGPEACFSPNIHSTLEKLYPAHLHVNLLESARAKGAGRMLMETYFEALREQRVCGVHVFCGDMPVRFYERMGFQKLDSIVYGGTTVHCLGLAL